MSRRVEFRDMEKEVRELEKCSYLLEDLLKNNIQNVDFSNKNNREIFGELYTRLRAEVAYRRFFSPYDEFYKCFSFPIYKIKRTRAGEIINEVINSVYEQYIQPKRINMFALESCVVSADLCLDSVDKVVAQAKEVADAISKIEL